MKIVKYIALFFTAVLWFAGCSGDFAQWLFDHKLIKDDYRYGDLYRMSNLPQFRELKETCEVNAPVKNSQVHLVLAGDSFTEEGRVQEDYLSAGKFTRIRVDEQTEVDLDTSDYNVLVIETVERHFRERFAKRWNWVIPYDKNQTGDSRTWYKKILDLKMPYQTERHEAVLFGYDWTMKVREWKALLNYKLFHRVDEGVALNRSEEHLLYRLPTQNGISSAFDPVSDEEIIALIQHVNDTYTYYLDFGFDDVILSIIPNKTSILGQDLGKYNKLVLKIETNPDLRMPVIDICRDFISMGEKAYAMGDTHWSCEGQQIWLDKLNERLVDQPSNVSTNAAVL